MFGHFPWSSRYLVCTQILIKCWNSIDECVDIKQIQLRRITGLLVSFHKEGRHGMRFKEKVGKRKKGKKEKKMFTRPGTVRVLLWYSIIISIVRSCSDEQLHHIAVAFCRRFLQNGPVISDGKWVRSCSKKQLHDVSVAFRSG